MFKRMFLNNEFYLNFTLASMKESTRWVGKQSNVRQPPTIKSDYLIFCKTVAYYTYSAGFAIFASVSTYLTTVVYLRDICLKQKGHLLPHLTTSPETVWLRDVTRNAGTFPSLHSVP